MARSSSEDTIPESILLSDGLDRTSSTARSSHSQSRTDAYDDDDYEDYYYSSSSNNFPRGAGPRRPSGLRRVLDFVGMNGRKRRRDFTGAGFHSSSSGEALAGLLARPSGRRRNVRETRTCRKGFVVGTVRKVLLFTPFAVLIMFGFLHIALVLIGRAHLFWDVDEYDDFLPDWGKPGQFGSALAKYPTDATRDVLPIACHSHNDYWRRIPLFEALRWGCTSVEADVWLFDNELFVGHTTSSLSRERTFRSLYVEPLVELLDSMNTRDEFGRNATKNGVFDQDPSQTLVLLVDIKSEPAATFELLDYQLQLLRERDYLTYYDGEKLVPRSVTVVGTGNTPFDAVASTTKRREIFFDAPLERFWEAPASPLVPTDERDTRPNEMDYGTAMSQAPSNMSALVGNTRPGAAAVAAAAVRAAAAAVYANPSKQNSVSDTTPTTDLTPLAAFDTTNAYYASTSFRETVGFVWRARLSPRQMEIIRGQIRGARRRGLKARYWDTPAWPVSLRNHIWQVLVDEGAEMLNVDDVRAAATEDWRRRVHRWWS